MPPDAATRSHRRPPRFRGHEALRSALGRALAAGALPATVLVHGAPGCGKQSLALWIARTRLCTGDPKPCGACRSCRMALRLEHPDIHWHFPLPRPRGASGSTALMQAIEGARLDRLAEYRANPLRPQGDTSLRGIYMDAARTIRRQAHLRPAMGDEQILILGDAEHLAAQEASQEAANALLKLLEEPPGGTRFILTTSRPGSLLDTIRSRSLPVHLPPLPAPVVQEFLESECGADSRAAARAAALGQGSIGSALGHLDPEGVLAVQRVQARALLKAALGQGRRVAYRVALRIDKGGARGMTGLLGALALLIRDLGAVALGRENLVVNIDHLPQLREAAGRAAPSPDHIARAVRHVEEARMMALGNVQPQLMMAGLLFELQKVLGPGGRAP